ncbi:MAG: Tn7 transposase TnsA N-terminal domain-containing protein [Burkholderiaceae bacterium]
MRPIVRRSNFRVTGKYPSFRNGKSIRWESFIEQDCFIRLDADPEVDSFQEQPAALHYMDDGIQRIHFPDLFLIRRGLRALWEIKSHTDPNLHEAQRRGALLAPQLLYMGFDYRVVTDIEIRSEPQFSNAKMLLRIGRLPVNQVTREIIRRRVEKRPTTWHQILIGSLGPQGLMHVARLILDGALFYDNTMPICASTLISVSPTQKPTKGVQSWE